MANRVFHLFHFPLLQLKWGVQLDELVDLHKPASNADDDLPVFDLNEHSLGSKEVDTLLLATEGNLERLLSGVDEFRQRVVDRVLLDWDVYS
jgi:hypothetical protein